ncbi:MAG TPA: DUF4326 domain-containing protein [bacterium]|nr:DUF4326 domain-containing protein [bacterium]
MEVVMMIERYILASRFTKNPENSFRVTRPSRFQNKNKLIEHGGTFTREESLTKYEKDIEEELEKDPTFLDILLHLDFLCCYCKERPTDYKFKWWCHVEILIAKIKEILNYRKGWY